MKPDLSIIILSYNTLTTTQNCLDSLVNNFVKDNTLNIEIIVVDNASRDRSVEMIKNYVKIHAAKNIQFNALYNKKNLGFGGGSNQAIKKAKGRFILFLNSDTVIENVDFKKLIEYFQKDNHIGVLTVKVVLPSGEIDPASHRGFPTLWNSFSYFFKLEKLFGNIAFLDRIFGGYHLTYLSLNKIHEIDSPTGAFFLTKKEILEKVGVFDDKHFFMYGEDLDLSYRIKQAGYKIIYYPEFTVKHLKYQSGLQKADKRTQDNTKNYFYDAMKAFYKKHYESKYWPWVNKTIYYVIDRKKKFS